MRRSSATLLLVLLLAISAPAVEAGAKGVISCTPADLDMMPANWDIDDGACVRVDLGVLSPGDTLSFDVDASAQIDLLLFAASSISVYQNEQNYRHDSVWQEESVFESFQGEGTWHWTAPDDRGDTRWYLVIDNMAHPQDQGNGGQGGQVATIILDAEEVNSPVFGIIDTIVRIDTGAHEVLAGPIMLDEGTQVNLFATTMAGAPDIFLMTQSQLDLYEEGGAAAARIDETDMLLITDERTLAWSVTSEYAGEDLYLVVDNRPGPSGGGAGTGFVATTVVFDLVPVLDPTIANSTEMNVVDVGAEITLDASETPNLSDQIDIDTGFQWDTNGDGYHDTAGSSILVSWDEPTEVSVGLRVVSRDGRSQSIYLDLSVQDISPPSVSLSASDTIRKDFDDQLLLTASIEDNWAIQTVEWLVDDEVIDYYSNWDWQDGKTFTFRFDSSYTPGEHEVKLRVIDRQGLMTEEIAIIDLYDSTPPIVAEQTVEMTVILGEPHQFQAEAMDAESPNLLYYWDFDVEVDSDSDGVPDNDVDASGPKVIQDFQKRGTFQVLCTIVNDAGVSTEITYFVTVRSASDDGGGLSTTNIVIIAIVATLILVAGVGMIAWRRMSNARLEALLSEQAAAAEEEPRELSVEEQKAMFGAGSVTLDQPTSMATTSPFGQFATGMSGASDPQATIDSAAAMGDVDLEALMSTSSPITADSPSSPAADLLAEFSADESAVEREELEFSHDEQNGGGAQVWSPDAVDSAPTEDSLPTPPAPAPEPQAEALLDEDEFPTPPPPVSEPDVPAEDDVEDDEEEESEDEVEFEENEEEEEESEEDEEEESEEDSTEPESEPQSRLVQKDCSQCHQRFEVTLPEGHNVARTACPSCGAIETVSLN